MTNHNGHRAMVDDCIIETMEEFNTMVDIHGHNTIVVHKTMEGESCPQGK